jgi:peptide/nickel transport system substrate-binding protein
MRSLIAVIVLLSTSVLSWGAGQLRFCIRYDPRTFHPLKVEDDASEVIRYLTGGVLVRSNRVTQQLEPELAESWKVTDAGKTFTFRLRSNIRFSDGTPFDAEDVAATLRALLDPALHSPTGDAFRTGSTPPAVQVLGRDTVSVTFGSPLAGGLRLFDQVAIMSTRSPKKELAVLGPFMLGEHKPGVHVRLTRNPFYWKRDNKGTQLPYLDAVHIRIQNNRELEALAFRRGEIDLINGVDPVLFEQLARELPEHVRDLGASLDSDFMWFNQMRGARIPEHRKDWFRSSAFRRALSMAINREDICRIVYRGHARPAAGPFPPANRLWYNSSLPSPRFDPKKALALLESAGFRHNGGVLRDPRGNPVSFSLLTNAGNKARERVAAMIQRDLRSIGVQMNVVTLDFPSLLERIGKTGEYEACLLGFINVDPDPNGQMNVWLSSSSNHPWNPRQKSPDTPWEAEIDKHMQAQSATPDQKKRKALFDKVQEIAAQEVPIVYLVHPNALAAVAPGVRNLQGSILRPQLLSNIDRIYVEPASSARASR